MTEPDPDRTLVYDTLEILAQDLNVYFKSPQARDKILNALTDQVQEALWADWTDPREDD